MKFTRNITYKIFSDATFPSKFYIIIYITCLVCGILGGRATWNFDYPSFLIKFFSKIRVLNMTVSRDLAYQETRN